MKIQLNIDILIVYNTIKIYVQDKAGHNDFCKEKTAITNFNSNELHELTKKSEGIKFLMRIFHLYV